MGSTLKELASHLDRGDIVFLGTRKKDREKIVQSLSFDVPVNWPYEELLLFSIFGKPEEEMRIILKDTTLGDLPIFTVKAKRRGEGLIAGYLQLVPTPLMKQYWREYNLLY